MADKKSETGIQYPYSNLALHTKTGGYAGCVKSDSVDLNGDSPFTITAWVYLDSVDDGQIMLSQDGGVSFFIQYGRPYLRWSSSDNPEETDSEGAQPHMR